METIAETKAKISIAGIGRVVSAATREKQSNARKKLILNVETGIYYHGTADAADSVGINMSTMYNILTGISKNKTKLVYV